MAGLSDPPSLNTVLYGPPGTGKTYRTAAMAVRICDGSVPSDRTALMERFKALREVGQVEFVTLHQSYGYEEFIEGIRPVLSTEATEDNDTLNYEYTDGVFKRICDSAGSSKRRASPTDIDPASVRVWKMSLGNTQDAEESLVYDECLESNYVLLGYGGDLDFAKATSRDAVEKLALRLGSEVRSTVSMVHAFRNEMQIGDLVVITDGNRRFRAIGRISGDYAFANDATYHQSRPVEWLVIYDDGLPCERIYRKRFTQRTIYRLKHNELKIDALRQLLSDDAGAEDRNFVIIIDELNRGNIAKVLGELITLLEPDKRLGAANELIVTLPYSSKTFGVPANLYVIGTMNTADRSIAFLDTAIRRRFTFEEVMPDPQLIRELVGSNGVIDGYDVAQLLTTINQRVELLFDRDHQIGHSYLLGISSLGELRSVFRRNVIPLLQEYFYGDWAKVAMVLGCPFDPDDGRPARTNDHPLLRVERLDADRLLGYDGSEIENRICCAVNPAFLEASDKELRPFFESVIA